MVLSHHIGACLLDLPEQAEEQETRSLRAELLRRGNPRSARRAGCWPERDLRTGKKMQNLMQSLGDYSCAPVCGAHGYL